MGEVLQQTLRGVRWIATYPSRRWNLRQLSLRGAAPLHVVFYHRVADAHPTPWTCPTATFAKHLDLIGSQCEWIDLPELQRRVREGHNPRPAAHITFDDGYADNNDFALPELVRRKIPCTYFVTHDNIVHQRYFAHDLKLGLQLAPQTLNDLRHWAQQGIEIGGHSRTHCDFGQVSSREKTEDEIARASQDLGHLLGTPIRYFAFPFGFPKNMPPLALEAVQRSGLLGFCSAFGGYNTPGRDAFHIRRFHGDVEMMRLRNWLSFDGRKLRAEPPLRYRTPV